MFQIFKKSFLFFCATIILGTLLAISYSQKARATQGPLTPQAYLPIVVLSERTLPPPAGVAVSIPLPEAECPTGMSFNHHTKFLYTTNETSDNVSLIHGDAWVGNLVVGNWPAHVSSDPNSSRTYITTVFDGISILNGAVVTKHIPPFHESYTITINTVNGYTYINDLHEPITILQGDEKVTDLFVPDYNGHHIVWQLTGDFDRNTGKTYFASWQHGILTEVTDTAVTDQFEYFGIGAVDMVIDSQRGLIYIANSRPGAEEGPHNSISVVNIETKAVFMAFTSQRSRHLDLDPHTGIVYVSNPKDDTITVIKDRQILGVHPVGAKPWDVAVDQTRGYAYIGNSEDNTVSIFQDGAFIKKITLPEGKGYKPWRIVVDQESHDVYVLNRSSYIEVYDDTGRTREVCEQPWVHILR